MNRIKAKLLIFTSVGLLSSISIASPTVYIPLGSANKVIKVDAQTDTITATYSNVNNPHGLVATPDGEYVIVGSLTEKPAAPGDAIDTPNSKLYLIHPEHGHVMSTIDVVGWTHHQAITPDGRYVISTHGLRGSVSVVDLKENKVIKTIKTGAVPNYTLITKDGKRAFVSNTGANSISEIDLATFTVTRNLKSGSAPGHMVFSNDEQRIFVANSKDGNVAVVSVKTGEIVKVYNIGKSVHGLDISDDGKTIFISRKKDNVLVALNLKTGNKRELALSPAPYHLNTIRGTGKIYISSSNKPLIWVVNQKSLAITNTIKLSAGEAHQMAVVN